MRRNALGFVAGFLLAIGAITVVSQPKDASALAFAGSCIKAGLVLGALWLALPQLTQFASGLPRAALKWLVGKGKSPSPPTNGNPTAPKPQPRRRGRI